jgi:hypothetical protein
MLEFFYTIFLLRLGSQLLTKTIKTPQAFGNVLKVVGYVLGILSALMLYGTFTSKNVQQSELITVFGVLPVFALFVGINIWGGTILEKTSQEHYEQMHTFIAVGRGFLAVATVFIFFASLNIVFGFILVMCALFWLVLFIGTLGTILLDKSMAFEKFIYIPEQFFRGEAHLFKMLGLDVFMFAVVLGLVVVLTPFLLSLWAIIIRKKLVINE